MNLVDWLRHLGKKDEPPDRSVEELIRFHEGLRLLPYEDAGGTVAIGYGRNLTRSGISHEEAEFLLRNDVRGVRAGLDAELPSWRLLSPVRQAVLIDMAYNLGVAGLLKFKRTLEHVFSRQYEEAAVEMLNSRWATQVGRRARRLSQMMRSDKWPGDL